MFAMVSQCRAVELQRRSAASARLGLFILVVGGSPSFAAEPNVCLRDGKKVLTNSPCESIGASLANPRVAPQPTVQTAPPPVIAPEPAQVAPPAPRTVHSAHTPAVPRPSIVEGLWAGLYGALLQPALLFLFAVLAALVILAKFARRRLGDGALWNVKEPVLSGADEGELPPYKTAPMLTAYESVFFQRLKSALPEFDVFPQAPLAAFIQIDRAKAGAAYFGNSYRWQNRIGQQRVDFLICRPDNHRPIAAVELDDPSHDRAEAQARDEKKDQSLLAAQVPLVRWRVESMPSIDEIRAGLGLASTASNPI